MPPQLCRNFQRGYCQYGERCKFSHGNQQQAKPNPFGFGSQNATQSPRTDPQPQKPNPFGFGVQNNSQTGSKPNQFKPGENKWSRFSPINNANSSAPQKQDNQPNHECTDSESCKRQISEDYQHEKPLWKLTCYGHRKYGPCDIIGDISCEELRAASYDDAKRGMNIQSIVDKERSLVSSKLIEFENLLRNPYNKPPQNSTLTTQNTFSETTPQMVQNNPTSPPTVSSFSQLGTTVNSGFQMRPAAPNSIFGQVNQFQPPSQTSHTNSLAFGNPGSQPSTQSFVSSLPATTTTTFGNAFSNPQVPRQQSSMPFGSQNLSASVVPESVQITQNIQTSISNGDNSIWFKQEWRPGEIPEEAPPQEVIY